MKRNFIVTLFAVLVMMESSCYAIGNSAVTPAKKVYVAADHNSIKLNQIPLKWINKAKKDLHIAYGHSSHGSQITYGLLGLTFFKEDPFIYKKGLPKDSLDLRDNPFGGEKDLGNPDNKTWAEETRKYLQKNKDINVVMWSWCGQLSKADREFVKNYLDLMQGLEVQFPDVKFIYMTGHLDGTGEEGTLALSNNQIREFCSSNNKMLFDFADIESYNPDGVYFGDKYANADCSYDSDGDKKQDKNWAQEWQNSHKKGVDWFECYSAHTEPINANMKANAFWWLLARAAGWSGEASDKEISEVKSFDFYAEKLQTLNLLKGSDKGFELGSIPTRLEGAAMLTRLLGGEAEAQNKLYSHPFKDAEKTWGNHYVGYVYHYNLAKGISGKKFGCELKLEATAYMTFLLRVLGYSDNSPNRDFIWNKSLEAAKGFGIISSDYYSTLIKGDFDRGHMAKMTYLTLTQNLKGKDITLLEKLVNDKVVDKKAAELL